jgi:hypothetical protein
MSRVLRFVAIAAVTIVAAAPARAACLEEAAEVLWSLPAPGDIDVPSNTKIWIVTSLISRGLLVEVDGVAAQRDSEHLAPFDPGSLAPGEHSVDVSVFEPDGTRSLIQSFTFTSSETIEDVASAPRASRIERVSERPLSDACARALRASDCFDSGQDTHFVVDATEARGHLVTASFVDYPGELQRKIWPGECGSPEAFLGGAGPEVCIDVATIGFAGVSAPTTVCETTSEGCAQSPPAVFGILALLLLAVRRVSP